MTGDRVALETANIDPGQQSAKFLRFIDQTIERLESHGIPSRVHSCRRTSQLDSKSALDFEDHKERRTLGTNIPFQTKYLLTTGGSFVSSSPVRVSPENTDINTIVGKMSTATTKVKRQSPTHDLRWQDFLNKRPSKETISVSVTPEQIIEENASLKLKLLESNRKFEDITQQFRKSREKTAKLKEQNKQLEKKIAKLVLLESLADDSPIRSSPWLAVSRKSSVKDEQSHQDNKAFGIGPNSSLRESVDDQGRQSFTLLIKNKSAVSSQGHSRQNSQILLNFGRETVKQKKPSVLAKKAHQKTNKVSGILGGLFNDTSAKTKEVLLKKSKNMDRDNRIVWAVRRPATMDNRIDKSFVTSNEKAGSDCKRQLRRGPAREIIPKDKDASDFSSKIRPSLNTFLRPR